MVETADDDGVHVDRAGFDQRLGFFVILIRIALLAYGVFGFCQPQQKLHTLLIAWVMSHDQVVSGLEVPEYRAVLVSAQAVRDLAQDQVRLRVFDR